MRCESCGAELAPVDVACGQCGARVSRGRRHPRFEAAEREFFVLKGKLASGLLTKLIGAERSRSCVVGWTTRPLPPPSRVGRRWPWTGHSPLDGLLLCILASRRSRLRRTGKRRHSRRLLRLLGLLSMGERNARGVNGSRHKGGIQ